jgi:4-hydroxythreonine-4-phosphate dehydrogenase
MSSEQQKPVIGLTCGDLNGIGLELIIKTVTDNRLLDICTPVIFASNKSINFYRKSLPELNMNYASSKDATRISHKQINVVDCWDEEVQITPGILNEIGGKYALLSLQAGVKALKEKQINALVTAPIHKKNIQTVDFKHSGHTPFLKEYFNAPEVVMLMVASNMRVALLSEHITVSEVAKYVTKENIIKKLRVLNSSLQKDFGVAKPRIAVLGLNPHAGDEGLIGKEEIEIIKPAIKEAKQQMMVFGPFSADAFFARGQYEKFDAVLAMYHDQGLIPFKSLAFGEGVNYTAGLGVIRTSPDHGTAFDIAGKSIADHSSFLTAIYEAIDIYRQQNGYAEARQNPLKKMSNRFLANAVDEKIEETE